MQCCIHFDVCLVLRVSLVSPPLLAPALVLLTSPRVPSLSLLCFVLLLSLTPSGAEITINCAGGEDGRVYEGLIPFTKTETSVDSVRILAFLFHTISVSFFSQCLTP